VGEEIALSCGSEAAPLVSREDRMLARWTRADRLAFVVAVSASALASCHSAGLYGHSKVYAPLSAEERALGGSKEYGAVSERAPGKSKDRSSWLFGVVTNRGSGTGGAAYLALSIRALQLRNLCESDDEDSCRVTVSEREMGRVHALVALASEDDMGQESVGLGSLVRIVGTMSDDLDPNDGTPIVRASYYRHWPRGFYVTTKASSFMKR
jgi:hypothetical protein